MQLLAPVGPRPSPLTLSLPFLTPRPSIPSLSSRHLPGSLISHPQHPSPPSLTGQTVSQECIEIAQCKVQKCRSCLESLAAAYERPDVSYQSQLQSFDDISVYLCNYSQWCTGNWPRQVLDQIASGITYALMVC